MGMRVKYFAGLREQLGRSEELLEAGDLHTVRDVWDRVSDGSRWPENLLAAVNLDYVSPDQQVKDGDEIAFFPPVTGG